MSMDSLDHMVVGADLARRAGVNLNKARPRTQKLWEARGLALIALSRGNMDEALKIMSHCTVRANLNTLPAAAAAERIAA
ncbi:MAG: hypothetical protein ACOH1V_02470 [Stenotrophomonas sp.]